jgi:hypothetical protein
MLSAYFLFFILLIGFFCTVAAIVLAVRNREEENFGWLIVLIVICFGFTYNTGHALYERLQLVDKIQVVEKN